MRRLLLIPAFVATTMLAACGGAAPGDDNGGPDDPGGPLDPVKPSAQEVLDMGDDFGFTFMPGANIGEVEWDVEIDYDTQDVPAVFDFYDAALIGMGYTQTSIDTGDDEIEADYSHATLPEVEIEVELDDGNVQVDFDTDEFGGPFPTGFTWTSFSGLDLPIYDGADVVDVEWDFNFTHPANGAEEVFDYYDQHLVDLGWTLTDFDDDDDDEMEAEYEKDGVHMELEVEGDTEVELEVNKLRFY